MNYYLFIHLIGEIVEVNMEKQLKKWEMPQLIILAQGTPEESVLYHCKVNNVNDIRYDIPGPAGFHVQSCSDPGSNCTNCSARAHGT